MFILVFNIGSSTIKYELFSLPSFVLRASAGKPGLKSITAGIVDKITKNHEHAIQEISRKLKGKKIVCIGHRVVHGEKDLWKPTIINKKVIKKIKEFSDLAPLHNPANLAGILACKKLFPHIPQIAVFDTGFHHTIPEIASTYALPKKLTQKFNIKKYGFHGISTEYVFKEAEKTLGKKKTRKTVVCHLGNGCSITAVLNGKSIDTSMGFTPLGGVPMGTRSGDLDPGILLFLLKKGFSAKKLDEILNYESGLKGISSLTWDMRVLHKASPFTVDVFVYNVAKYIAGCTTALGGLDVIVFTGGIGENAWYVRDAILQKLKFLKAKALVVKTDEARFIAQEIVKLNKKWYHI